MILGKLPVAGRPTIWMIEGQGPIAFAVGAGEGYMDIFIILYPFSPLSPVLWETVRYRLKYYLKGPLNPKQPTNQPTYISNRNFSIFIRPFEKRSYYVIPLGVRPSVCPSVRPSVNFFVSV